MASQDGFERTNRRCHAERAIRIACIGAGPAGLCFAYKLQRSFRNFSLTIYERNAAVGGVWLNNRYPGVACDVPAHNFTYSWEPSLHFTSEYAKGEEICKYFSDFAAKYDLLKYCKFTHCIQSLIWLEECAQWKVKYAAGDGSHHEELVDIVINAAGTFSEWRFPKIPGFDRFQGQKCHSAFWDEKISLVGKKVGLIGNGASGQQLLAAIQPQVASLVHFIRQPNWVLGPFVDPPRDYSADEMALYASNSDALQAKRRATETSINSLFTSFLQDSPLQKHLLLYFTQSMQQSFDSMKLPHSLLPNFAIGCRRPTTGIGYLEALSSPNVQTVLGDIQSITADSVIHSTGTAHRLEVLILATGFDGTFIPPFDVVGESGERLADAWHDDVDRSYMATAAPGFPNYLFFMGPYNPGTTGTHVRAIEIQADYMLQLVDRYQTENMRSFAPRADAAADFTAYAKQVLKRTVWSEACEARDRRPPAGGGGQPSSSSSQPSSSRRLALWPGSCLHFADALRELRADDWDVRYRGNRFAWMGNGLSATGADPTSDIAWYIADNDEGGPLMSRRARREVFTRSGSFPDREDRLAQLARTAD